LLKHLSTIKRSRQSVVRRARNVEIKSRLKTLTRKLLTSVEANEPEEARENLRTIIPEIDKAASKGIIHHRTAARRISRLTKRVNKLQIQA